MGETSSLQVLSRTRAIVPNPLGMGLSGCGFVEQVQQVLEVHKELALLGVLHSALQIRQSLEIPLHSLHLHSDRTS